jgi:hypothetical protein
VAFDDFERFELSNGLRVVLAHGPQHDVQALIDHA